MSLSKSDRRYFQLLQATCEKEIQKVKNLLRKGADPNHKPVTQNQDLNSLSTPLQIACMSSNEKIVETLLKYKANPEVFTVRQPLSPLCLACMEGSANIVRLILNSGR